MSDIQNQNQEVQQHQNDVQSALVPSHVIESLVLNGDLSKMNSEQKVTFYNGICKSLGLNPLTQPFEIINLKGKLKMYAKKDATDQLRKVYGVSVTSLKKEQIGDIYMVTAEGQDRTGRTDSAIGAVTIANLMGENLANAIMKAETKAKRRLTLSICGLGMLDETEVDSITSNVENVPNNHTTNIDCVDPTNEKDVNELEQMINSISDTRVPSSLFGGQSKEDFAKDFKEKLHAGTLPMEFARNVYSQVWKCFA